jgi:hypothetical protein
MKTTQDNRIDLTPLWSGILPALIAVLQTGSAEGRKLAIDELYRMAEAADAYNETIKTVRKQ